ncbi:hypothetical protein CIG75_11915 [Tumebacillus algifaecis]|uniref:Flagellar Assembly Protein A N-terminal region domain-containing protein n=1 Tax=Tumebacillus algifaecis TaxID=1214604 RepID=A0A223D2A7_9BACL|nr:FapA family protein [Tumebacillus algifaecis]ASS75625.1 hypothetical protein CIG75_11915 [Tumebacillus algifaecis]
MENRQDETAFWLKNGKVTVEGALTAYLTLSETLLQEQNFPHLTYNGLVEFLRHNGVTFGIDMVSCQQIVMNPRGYIGFKQKVAVGKAPINGENAVIEILLEDITHVPRELEDGRVDFFDLGVVRTVHKGQILAKKKLPTEGVQGVGVNGAPIMAKPGRDYRLPHGKNTVISENGLELIADKDGHVSYTPRDVKIHVFDVFEVNSDIDFSVGNIDFLGTVRIRGNVLPGFRIVAAGDIEVAGNVESAVLEAGGDIIIRGGVQARGKGMIKAGGSVRARFMQGAIVEAGVDVIVRDSIMHCTISAGRSINMQAQKAVIVGGLVRAGEEVRTRTLGSPMATPTEVEVGVHPQLRTEMQGLHQRMKDLHQNMDKSKKALTLLDNMAGIGNQLPPDKAALRQNLSATYQHYLREEEELMYRRSEIEAILLDTKRAKVYCLDVLYGGVKLTLGTQVAYMRDTRTGPVVFGITDGELTTNVVY